MLGTSEALRKKKALAIAASVLSAIFIFLLAHRFILSAEIDRFGSLHGDITFAKDLLAIKEANYTAVAGNIDKPELAKKTMFFATYEAATDAALWVGQAMEEERLTQNSFSTQQPRSSGFAEDIYMYTVEVSGVGSYEAVMAFISRLEDAPYYYEINSMEMSSERVTANGDVSLTMEISYFISGQNESLQDKEEYDVSTGNPFYYPRNKE